MGKTGVTTNTKLLEQAKQARLRAYAPYSNYLVGACLVDEHGNTHEGCNVENAAYPLSACAEANAIGAMILAGGTKIVIIAIAGGTDSLEACKPCGACRQQITEFADTKTTVVLLNDQGEITAFSCAELLPHAFSLDN